MCKNICRSENIPYVWFANIFQMEILHKPVNMVKGQTLVKDDTKILGGEFEM